MMTVLLIHENQALAESFADFCAKNEIQLSRAPLSLEAAQSIRQMPVNAVVLQMSPNLDLALAVCKGLQIVTRASSIPIISLIDRVDENIVQLSLQAGADDFVVFPLENNQIVSRIKLAQLRKLKDSLSENLVQIGNLRLDTKIRNAKIEDRSVKLTSTEAKLLQYFIHNANKVIPREQLLGELWNGRAVTARTIDTHLANLRKKLRTFSHPIETIHGSGYVLKS